MTTRFSRRQLAALSAIAAATSMMQRDLAAHTHSATPVASPAATPVVAPAEEALIVRKNAKHLTAEEKKAYTDAVLALKAKPSPWNPDLNAYDQFVFWHREAFECDNMAAHMGPAFLPWHRGFLWLFEQLLREVDPTVSIPYWDWAVDREVDSYIWQDDLMGGDGDPEDNYAVQTGPFRQGNWEIAIFDWTDDEQFPHLIRNMGVGDLAPDLPTVEQVEEALALDTYDVAPWTEQSDPTVSFRNYMEGWRDCLPAACATGPDSNFPDCPGSHDMHNRVHLWISGEMMFSHEGGHEEKVGPFGTMAWDTSPNDPVFFLHHANVDRIWTRWMERHGRVYEPESGAMHGHNLNDHMWPFSSIDIHLTPAMVLDSRNLGIVYDTDSEQ